MDVLILAPLTAAADVADKLPAGTRRSVVHDWSSLLRRLTSPTPPSGLVISADALDEQGVGVVRQLHKRGFLVPTAALLPRTDSQLFERVYPLSDCGVMLLFADAPDVARRLERLVHRSIRVALAEYLRPRLGADCPAARALLDVLAASGEAVLTPIDDLAVRLKLARRTVYAQLDRVGLPGPEQFQRLFRLMPAVQILAAGGPAEDAASAASLADSRCLRKALLAAFGASIGDVRGNPGWRSLADQWLARHGQRP